MTQPYRKARALFANQVEMARALDVTPQAVSRWSQGAPMSLYYRCRLYQMAQREGWELSASDLQIEVADLLEQLPRPPTGGRTPSGRAP